MKINYLSIIKGLMYCVVFYLLCSDVLNTDERVSVFFVYIGLIYYHSNDRNISSLLFVLIIVEVAFYELDYIFYILGKYYWLTGSIAGDLLLDIVTLINMIFLMLSIYYRSEIMEYFTKLFKLDDFIYLPTKADIMQIYVIRFVLLIKVGFILTSVYLAHNINISSGNTIHLKKELIDHGHNYVAACDKLMFLRYFVLVFLLNPRSKEKIINPKEIVREY